MNSVHGQKNAPNPEAIKALSRFDTAFFRVLRYAGLGYLALGALLIANGATISLDSLVASKNHVQADLISEVTVLKPGGLQPFWVAIRLQIEPGWHTYWVNPGDAGQATTIKWELPSGWTAGEIQWPTPHRLPLDQLMNYGYEGTVVLLVQLTPPRDLPDASKASLRAHVEWTECSATTCIPNSKDLTLELPQSFPATNAKSIIDEAVTRLPQPPASLNVSAWRSGNKLYLGLEARPGAMSPNLPNDAYFYSRDAQTQAAAPQILHHTDAGWILEMTRSEGAPPGVKLLPGVLTFDSSAASGGTGIPALAIDAPLDAGPPPSLAAGFNGISGAKDFSGLLALLGLGFIGGLILNIMPCVFPVLALKVLGFVKQAGAERRKVVLHGLTFTAGVFLSMWTLVGVLQFLRAAGSQLGWGFQLQEPGFVLGLVMFLLIFALSLSGVFEIGGSLIGLGSGLTAKAGLGGSFFQGVLAVVLATPCTAPVLAPALGTALTLPAGQAFLVFTFIALGLAAPYLTLSLFPSLTRWLPRPGAWMETFKELMAFPLYATIGFLLYTLAGQLPDERFLNVLFALVLVALAAWIYGRYAIPSVSTVRRRFGQVAGLLVLMSGVALAYHPTQELNWQPWSPELVAKLQKAGQPIYVDFTARWCATCQVDKDRVFGSQKVLDAIAKQNIALLKADWTNQDPRITVELARFGQSAVPLNLLYLPGRDAPIVLPVFPSLTPETVLNYLAGGASAGSTPSAKSD